LWKTLPILRDATKKSVQLATWVAQRLSFGSDRRPGQEFWSSQTIRVEVDALGGAPGVHSAACGTRRRGRGQRRKFSGLLKQRQVASLSADVPREETDRAFSLCDCDYPGIG